MKEKIGAILAISGVVVFSVLFGSSSDDGTGTRVESVSEVETLPLDTKQIEPGDPSGDYYVNNGSSDCTQDCSGHEAGYQWAEENDVCDPEFDGANSESFADGVREYAYDNCYYEDEDGAF
jgi:hypothetical protein